MVKAINNLNKLKNFNGTDIERNAVFTGSLEKLDKYPKNKDKIKSTQIANFSISFGNELKTFDKEKTLVKKELKKEKETTKNSLEK